MIQELQMLWDHGILVDGITWRVALVNGIWDGKGFEMVTKTMGAGSLKGCNVCNFEGVYFGKTMKYPFYGRYAPTGDSRRDKRPSGVRNASVMYNVESTQLARPKVRTYAQYVSQCFAVESGREESNLNGVHGIWTLHGLSYAKFIHPTKDSMHCANNSIRNSICVLKPNTTVPTKFENRTTRPNVVASCRQFRIFPFVYADEPSFPWILSAKDITVHDDRFKHVVGKSPNIHYN
jgi:hypothetical protein